MNSLWCSPSACRKMALRAVVTHPSGNRRYELLSTERQTSVLAGRHADSSLCLVVGDKVDTVNHTPFVSVARQFLGFWYSLLTVFINCQSTSCTLVSVVVCGHFMRTTWPKYASLGLFDWITCKIYRVSIASPISATSSKMFSKNSHFRTACFSIDLYSSISSYLWDRKYYANTD